MLPAAQGQGGRGVCGQSTGVALWVAVGRGHEGTVRTAPPGGTSPPPPNMISEEGEDLPVQLMPEGGGGGAGDPSQTHH